MKFDLDRYPLLHCQTTSHCVGPILERLGPELAREAQKVYGLNSLFPDIKSLQQ